MASQGLLSEGPPSHRPACGQVSSSHRPTDKEAQVGRSPFFKRTKRNQVTSSPQEKRHKTEVCRGWTTSGTGRGYCTGTQRLSAAAPQSPSASESANFSSHLTSNGLSLPGSSSILCESSLSVGALLAVVSCSVS